MFLYFSNHQNPCQHFFQLERIQRLTAVPHWTVRHTRSLRLQIKQVVLVFSALRAANESRSYVLNFLGFQVKLTNEINKIRIVLRGTEEDCQAVLVAQSTFYRHVLKLQKIDLDHDAPGSKYNIPFKCAGG